MVYVVRDLKKEPCCKSIKTFIFKNDKQVHEIFSNVISTYRILNINGLFDDHCFELDVGYYDSKYDFYRKGYHYEKL